MSPFTESIVEDAALAWLEVLGYTALRGSDIAAGEFGAERSVPSYCDVVLDGQGWLVYHAPIPGSIVSVLVKNYRDYGTMPA